MKPLQCNRMFTSKTCIKKKTVRTKILLVFVIFLCDISSKVISIICSAKVNKMSKRTRNVVSHEEPVVDIIE